MTNMYITHDKLAVAWLCPTARWAPIALYALTIKAINAHIMSIHECGVYGLFLEFFCYKYFIFFRETNYIIQN